MGPAPQWPVPTLQPDPKPHFFLDFLDFFNFLPRCQTISRSGNDSSPFLRLVILTVYEPSLGNDILWSAENGVPSGSTTLILLDQWSPACV